YIIVGLNGYYAHFDASNTLLTYSTDLPSTGNFRDLVFTDNIRGIVVGDEGLYYRTTNPNINTNGYLTSVKWEQIDLTPSDPLNVDEADIYTISAGSHSDILIGGVNPSGSSSLSHPYVRKVKDASGRYSAQFFYDRLGRIVASRNS